MGEGITAGLCLSLNSFQLFPEISIGLFCGIISLKKCDRTRARARWRDGAMVRWHAFPAISITVQRIYKTLKCFPSVLQYMSALGSLYAPSYLASPILGYF
jgi:hypothetical protein